METKTGECEHCGRSISTLYKHQRGKWVCADVNRCAARWLKRQETEPVAHQGELGVGPNRIR